MSPSVPVTTEPLIAFDSSVLIAPNHWREIDFISDLHLQDDEPATFFAWQSFMQKTPADAVFILGDLFEVWVGDDVIEAPSSDTQKIASSICKNSNLFEKRCIEVLNSASHRLAIFVIHGNRDFLLSSTFEKTSGTTILNDPTCLAFAGQRWLLSHGDALCLDDTDYLAFRALVRSTDWKKNFLSQSCQARQAIAYSLRQQSELRKKSGQAYADVDEGEAVKWLLAHQASTLIHGHTHKPADHDLPSAQTTELKTNRLQRLVLSDWDAGATPPRQEVLRLGVGHPPLRIKT